LPGLQNQYLGHFGLIVMQMPFLAVVAQLRAEIKINEREPPFNPWPMSMLRCSPAGPQKSREEISIPGGIA